MRNRLLILLLFVSATSFAQMRKANYLYELYRYHEAIDVFKKVIKKSKGAELQEAVTKTAHCYRLLRDNENAYKWYSKAIEFPKVDNDIHFYLAESLRGVGRYNEAADRYRKYAALTNNQKDALKLAEYCIEVKKWDNLEPDFSITNCEKLNTEFSEYSPVRYMAGLLFASDRGAKRGKEPILSMYKIDNLDSKKVKPLQKKRKSSLYHDGPASVCCDDKEIYFTRVYSGGLVDRKKKIITSLLQIFSSTRTGTVWSEPIAFKYNKDSSSVGHPTVSADGNTMYFSSNMKGGVGGSDIYVCKKVNGEWSKPENLGDVINTKGKELFPYLHNKNELYFASNGHCGYGGLDIFKTEKVDGKWQKPVNLRTPVNSPYDDFGIVLLDELWHGYISSNRKGSKGGDDIYKIKPYVGNKYHEVCGRVKSDIHGYIHNAKIFFLNETTNQVEIATSDAEGRFCHKIERGCKYNVKITADYHFSQNFGYFLTKKTKVKNPKFSDKDFVLERMPLKIARYADTVFFGLNKHNLRPRSKATLKDVKEYLNNTSGVKLLISSFTDTRGSVEYNKKLSERRANSVHSYLLEIGANATQVEIRPMGEFGNEDRGDDADENYHQFCRRADLFLEFDKPELYDGYDVSRFVPGRKYNKEDFDKNFF